MNNQKRIGLIIIGDEILSGKRVDKHLTTCIKLLNARGMQLGWANMIRDNPIEIINTLKWSFQLNEPVFVTGGIGATPDDHTRESAAIAFNKKLVLHSEAAALIKNRIRKTQIGLVKKDNSEDTEIPIAKMANEVIESVHEKIDQKNKESINDCDIDFSSQENKQRLKMGEFPEGAHIIPNPYNDIPGFSIYSHYFLPGFPVMAAPMMAWVLDHYYADAHHNEAYLEKSCLVFNLTEAKATPLMEEIETHFKNIKIFSLPTIGDEIGRNTVGLNTISDNLLARRPHIELGVKGNKADVEKSFIYLSEGIKLLGGEVVILPINAFINTF